MLPGAFLFEQFLETSDANALLHWAQELDGEGRFRDAAIGKNAGKQKNLEVRSDQICWLDPSEKKESHLVFNIFDNLFAMTKRDLLLPVKRYECHFAKYEEGSFYRPHRDRHKSNPSRLLTCVLYLNDLTVEDGGTLVVYENNDRKIEIQPKAGTLVFFDSQLLHEVKPSLKQRWSLTGWMRDDIHPGLNI